MNDLKFEACLSWPKTAEEIRAAANAANPFFVDEKKEIIFSCGLDASEYRLSAWAIPRWLSGDLNGDDAFDNVVTITRIADQRKGDAVCRAGTYLSLVGYGLAAHQPLKPGYYTLADYLDKVEFWELRQNDQRRDELVIGQVEKSEVAIFWKHSGVKHRRLWHFVEP